MEPFSIAPERIAPAGLIRFKVAAAGLRSSLDIRGPKFPHASVEYPVKLPGVPSCSSTVSVQIPRPAMAVRPRQMPGSGVGAASVRPGAGAPAGVLAGALLTGAAAGARGGAGGC